MIFPPTNEDLADYEPEYDLAAARKRNEHSKKTNPAFKEMVDRLPGPRR